MLSYIEYLNLPAKVAIALVGVFLITQIIGEMLEFKGKVVPEFLKVRKYFIRKKKDRDTLQRVPDILKEIQTKLAQNDEYIKKLDRKLDDNNKNTLSLLIDTKRNTIINFASNVIDDKSPATKEQFNRIFKLYTEYEEIIVENGLTNGEVDIAYHIIKEAYENRMKTHTFVEDLRGYKGGNSDEVI